MKKHKTTLTWPASHRATRTFSLVGHEQQGFSNHFIWALLAGHRCLPCYSLAHTSTSIPLEAWRSPSRPPRVPLTNVDWKVTSATTKAFWRCRDESSRMRILGKMWSEGVIFEERSFPHSALHQWGSYFIGQETEPLSLSAISFKPAATPCQSWFTWFGALKKEQCSMTDVSLHINTRSSKLTRAQADAEACPSAWSRLTGCSLIPALGDQCQEFNASKARLVCGKTFY